MKIFILSAVLFFSFNIFSLHSYTLNNISAYVNDEIISLIDINKMTLNYIAQGVDVNNPTLLKKILIGLIEDKLFSQITKKYKIDIDEDDLKNIALNKIEEDKSSFPNNEEFIKYLAKENLTEETYFQKLMEQLSKSEDLKKKLISDKFVNSQVGGNIIVTNEDAFLKYDYSIILTDKPEKTMEALLKLRRGESFESLTDKYFSEKIKTEKGRIGIKDIGESVLSIEFMLYRLKDGEISGMFPLTTDNGADMLGYAIVKLNKKIYVDEKSIKNELAQKDFTANYGGLGPINKEVIDAKYKIYKEKKERRLFGIKVTLLKSDIMKKIWDSGFIKIN
ncbi:MAG TPA: SurA N-terminal domain-containing protein [bacterium]|nr:SurA N-terminal domain-containing protein [bacterium]HPN29748.1 SurA N-terminal domain-containing protein [bacterium]